MSKKTLPLTRPGKHAADAMNDLARVSQRINEVRDAIEIHRAALVGLLHEAAKYAVPHGEELEGFLEPVTTGLLNLHCEIGTAQHLTVSAAQRLHAIVGCKGAR